MAEAIDGRGMTRARSTRVAAASVSWWRPRPARSTTSGARPATGGTRSPCCRALPRVGVEPLDGANR